MSDPRKYRTKEEEQRFEAEDPIDKLVEFLEAEHGMTADDVKSLTKEVKTQVRDAVKWAEASPKPDMSELYTDVYVEEWGPYTGTSLPEMLSGDDG